MLHEDNMVRLSKILLSKKYSFFYSKRRIFLSTILIFLLSGCAIYHEAKAVSKSGKVDEQKGALLRVDNKKVVEEKLPSFLLNLQLVKEHTVQISAFKEVERVINSDSIYEKIGVYRYYKVSDMVKLGAYGFGPNKDDMEYPLEKEEKKVIGEIKENKVTTEKVKSPLVGATVQIDCGPAGSYLSKTDEDGKAELDLKPMINRLVKDYIWTIKANISYNGQFISNNISLNSSDLGVNWSKPRYQTGSLPNLFISSISLIEHSGDGFLDASEAGNIKVTIKNIGQGASFGVALSLDANNIEEIEFTKRTEIGTLNPGEEKVINIPIKATEEIRDKQIDLKAILLEANGFDSKPIILSFKTRELRPPKLHVAKIEISDIDGKRTMTKGKEANITLSVKNNGTGVAKNLKVVCESFNSDVIVLGDNIALIDLLSPGELRKASFSIAITRRYSGTNELPVSFTILEERNRFSIKPDIKLVLGEEAPEIRVVKVESKEVRHVKIEVAENIETVPIIPTSQQMFNKNDIAIVIGIERYQNIPKSDFSYNDAKSVRGYLKALGFADRNIEFVTDEKATRSGIEKTVEKWLPNRAKKASKVLVYYSGHGSPDPETGEPYIVPNDGDPNYLSSTGYPLKRLYGELAKLDANEITVILDSCFSGAGGRSVLAKGARPLVIIGDISISSSNLAVMTAAQGSQISTSSTEKEHGVFTYYFLKAIKDGKKNLAEIYEYVKPRVEDEAKQLNVQQSPSMNLASDRLAGRFLLRK